MILRWISYRCLVILQCYLCDFSNSLIGIHSPIITIVTVVYCMFVFKVLVCCLLCSNVFNRNYLLSNQVWKYQRYILVIEYESKPILPSPLIILCHLYLLAKYVRRKWLNKKKFLDNGLSRTHSLYLI